MAGVMGGCPVWKERQCQLSEAFSPVSINSVWMRCEVAACTIV